MRLLKRNYYHGFLLRRRNNKTLFLRQVSHNGLSGKYLDDDVFAGSNGAVNVHHTLTKP